MSMGIITDFINPKKGKIKGELRKKIFRRTIRRKLKDPVENRA